MIIGVMVLIPLIFTEALPKDRNDRFFWWPPPPPPPPPPPAAAPVQDVKQIQTDIVNGELRTPTKIPQKIKMIQGRRSSSAGHGFSGVVGGVPGGVPGGSMGGVIGSVLSSTPVAGSENCHTQRVRVSSGVRSGLLVRKVPPDVSAAGASGSHPGHGDSAGEISKTGNIRTCS